MVKTTVDIDDDLLRRAKIRAASEDRTLRSVLEDALRMLLANEEPPHPRYRMPDRRVHGRGLSPEFEGRGWEGLAELAYEDRGA